MQPSTPLDFFFPLACLSRLPSAVRSMHQLTVPGVVSFLEMFQVPWVNAPVPQTCVSMMSPWILEAERPGIRAWTWRATSLPGIKGRLQGYLGNSSVRGKGEGQCQWLVSYGDLISVKLKGAEKQVRARWWVTSSSIYPLVSGVGVQGSAPGDALPSATIQS